MRPMLRRNLITCLLALGFASSAIADVPPPAASVSPAPVSPASLSTLVVTISGLPTASGHVIALLFPSDQGFPASLNKAAQHQALKVSSSSMELRFPNLPMGTYAVTVYHDVNDNGKLDTNWIGIPKEPVGVSNNLRPRLGPPRFSESSFTIAEPEHKIAVNLVTL